MSSRNKRTILFLCFVFLGFAFMCRALYALVSGCSAGSHDVHMPSACFPHASGPLFCLLNTALLIVRYWTLWLLLMVSYRHFLSLLLPVMQMDWFGFQVQVATCEVPHVERIPFRIPVPCCDCEAEESAARGEWGIIEPFLTGVTMHQNQLLNPPGGPAPNTPTFTSQGTVSISGTSLLTRLPLRQSCCQYRWSIVGNHTVIANIKGEYYQSWKVMMSPLDALEMTEANGNRSSQALCKSLCLLIFLTAGHETVSHRGQGLPCAVNPPEISSTVHTIPHH